MSFWEKLPRPFFAMAPMADVTDPAFRALVAKCGKPDITWTEFVSADGLYHTLAGAAENESAPAARPIQLSFSAAPAQANPLLRDLQFSEAERPVVAQIFSGKPEMIEYAAKLVAKLGFDGVDLNMGCPAGPVEKQGAGAALIKTPELASELIRAAQRGWNSMLSNSAYSSKYIAPVSVKTRIGYNRDMLDEWLPAIISASPAAITLHLRTRKQMSAVPADWERMRYAVTLRDNLAPHVLLIGNGDVMNTEEGRELARQTGADGIMIGRGIFGNPWIFEELQIKGRVTSTLDVARPTHGLEEKLSALVELAQEFERLSPPKHFAILKKHIKAFVAGFAGASELRARLMEAGSAAELEQIVRQHNL